MRVPFGWAPFAPKWGDGTLSILIHPLTTEQLLRATAKLSAKESQDMVHLVAPQSEWQTAAAAVLPECTKDFTGLEGDAGAVTIEQVCCYPQFMGLAMEILVEAIGRSRLQEADRGNLSAPAPDTGIVEA